MTKDAPSRPQPRSDTPLQDSPRLCLHQEPSHAFDPCTSRGLSPPQCAHPVLGVRLGGVGWRASVLPLRLPREPRSDPKRPCSRGMAGQSPQCGGKCPHPPAPPLNPSGWGTHRGRGPGYGVRVPKGGPCCSGARGGEGAGGLLPFCTPGLRDPHAWLLPSLNKVSPTGSAGRKGERVLGRGGRPPAGRSPSPAPPPRRSQETRPGKRKSDFRQSRGSF